MALLEQENQAIQFTQLGQEDLFWGVNSQTVVRFGKTYSIKEINAAAMTYDGTSTLKVILDALIEEIDLNTLKTGVTTEVKSSTTGITGADQITNMVSLTQAEYDAIGTPDTATFYVIVG